MLEFEIGQEVKSRDRVEKPGGGVERRGLGSGGTERETCPSLYWKVEV